MTLKWTRTPPTEAGLYFFRQAAERGGPGRATPIILEKNALGLIVPASNWSVVDGSLWIRGGIEWSGPIPPPEEAS